MEDTENTPQSFFKQSAPPNVIKSSSIGRNVTGISFDTNGIPHEVKGTIVSVNDGYVVLNGSAQVAFEDLTFSSDE